MSDRWVGRVESSSIQQVVDQLSVAVGELADIPNAVAYIARFKVALSYAANRIEEADPMLVTPQAISELLNAVNQALPGVANVPRDEATDPQPQLNTLDTQFDDIARAAALWPAPAGKLSPKFRKAVQEIADAAVTGRGRIEKAIKETEKRVADVVANVDEAKSAIEQAEAEHREQLTAVQTRLEAHETQLQNALTQQQATFDTQQQDRVNQFASQLEDQRTKATTAIDELTKTASDKTKAALDQASARVAELQQELDKAKDIVGLIAQTSMSGHYQTFANSEDKAASRWRITTVFMGSLFVLALGAMVAYEELSNVKVVTNPSKITLGLALTALASYCASQAAAHGRAARHARSLELALKSLPAYLEELDDEVARKGALESFAYYFFGREIPHTKGEDAYQPAQQWKPEFLARWFGSKPSQ